MSWVLGTALSAGTVGRPHPDGCDALASEEQRPGAGRARGVGWSISLGLRARGLWIPQVRGPWTSPCLAHKAVHPLRSDNQISQNKPK